MTSNNRKISLSNFLTIGPYEGDPGFREILTLLAHRGILITGLLGAVAVTIYVLSHILFVKTVVWDYSNIDPRSEIVLWDKILIFIFSLVCIGGARLNLSLRSSRILIAIVVCLASVAMLLDDIAGRDINLAPAYISFVLMVATGLMPYRGWQIALLNVSVILLAEATFYLAPLIFGLPDINFIISQGIYLVMVMILLTGISSQLYLNRYDQYRAQREAEELSNQLEEQAQKLLENERLKDRFFANISHEFRTPLTLILGPLEDLAHSESDIGEVQISKKKLKLMHKNGEKLLGLINQLLELSKIDAGQVSLKIQRIELCAFIDKIALSFIPMAEAKGIDLQRPKTKGPLYSTVDPTQLSQAIGNLISNALKFTPANGTVRVSIAEVDNSEIEIKVSDTGIGIDQKEFPYLFDRFYQASQDQTYSKKGTGIGLSLTKEIVELHGGTIKVQSKVGEGSEFIISLSKNLERNILPEELEIDFSSFDYEKTYNYVDRTNLRREEPNENSTKVLLVDDNPDILEYVTPILSQRYDVVSTQESKEVLKLLKNYDISLVISDVMMSPPNGFEICKTIKQTPELIHIPVILLTARSSEENRLQGLGVGADDYIIKPFSSKELLVRVENLIEIRQILREKYSEEVHLKGRKVDVQSEDARFLKQIQKVIDKHIGDSNFNVDWLASEVHLSSRQLQRKIQDSTNLSAGGYIRMMRLERAAQLLSQNWGNISETALKVGFQDPKYFSRLFKQTFGETPSEFAAKENE